MKRGRKNGNIVVALFVLYCLLFFTHCYACTVVIIYTSSRVSVKPLTKYCVTSKQEMKLSLSPRHRGVHSIIT